MLGGLLERQNPNSGQRQAKGWFAGPVLLRSRGIGPGSQGQGQGAFLYYGTNELALVAPRSSMAGTQGLSVRYITDAGELLR